MRPPPNPIPGGVARDAARRELRAPEYHRDDPGLLTRVLHWFGRRIADLFSGSASGNLTLLLVVLLGAVIVFALVKGGAPRRSGAVTVEDDPLARMTAVDHRRRATEHEAAGRWAEALREWLRATIGTIEERGVLEPRPGRTGAATAREAGPLLPSIAADLASAMATFDAVWFGERPAGAADAALARQVAEAVPRAPIERGATAGLVAPR